jgi:hypothetical protein
MDGGGGAGGVGGTGGVGGDGGTGGGPECKTAEECDDGDDCTDDKCTDGMCDYPAAGDGTLCSVDDLPGACTRGFCILTDAYPCTEQGIRDAIAEGGGPHYFACVGPTQVVTIAEILVDNNVILNGQGNMIVHAGYDGGDPVGGEHRVFQVDPDTTAELHGFTVSGGYADWASGIFVHDAALTLTNSTVTGNTASQAYYLAGGGGIGTNNAQLTLVNSAVTGNTTAAFGGGIRSTDGSTLTLIGSVIANNTAIAGGGIVNDQGAMTLTRSTVRQNEAVLGAGIYTFSGTLTLTDSQVSQNRADFTPCANNPDCGGTPMAAGGGILAEHTDVELLRTEVTRNYAGPSDPGGIGAGIISGSTRSTPEETTVTITNSTISSNRVLGDGTIHEGGGYEAIPSGTGAGIFNYREGATLVLSHVTLADNIAYYSGGAIYNTGTVSIGNSLIKGDCAGSGSLVTRSYNIESPADTCGFDENNDDQVVSVGALRLGSLEDNGGPTNTHALLLDPDSVAIDVIPSAMCGVATDQRGEPRPAGAESKCDVGSFEVQR